MDDKEIMELDEIYENAYKANFNPFKDNWKDVALLAMKNTHNQAVELCKKAIKEDRLNDLKVWAMNITNELPF